MILSKEIEVKVNCGNKAYLQKITNSNLKINDNIFINVSDLSYSCKYKVDVKCICNRVYNIGYKFYIRNVTKNIEYRCVKCCNPFNRKDIQDKIKATNLERYGVENAGGTEESLSKIKLTNLDRYGVENTFQVEEFKDKIKQTNLEKYGFEYASQSEEVKNKIKATNLERYGFENPSENKEVQDKIKATNLEKYGVENTFQVEEFKNKAKQSNLEKYGVEYPSQCPIFYSRSILSGYRVKKYNETLTYQGSYELDFLDYCTDNNIEIVKSPSINYVFECKNKVYHPDYYFKPLNLVIEIKSTYYYNLLLNKNEAKEEATIKAGYNYIVIKDKMYNDFNNLVYDKK